MKKILKITSLVLLILIILIILLPYIFRGKILEEAKKQINNNLNAKVEIGSIDIGIIKSFPNLNLQIENIIVINNKEFDSIKLLDLKKIQINLDLMSVIKGEKYIINKIYLNEPKINAIINKYGKANWDIAKNKDDSSNIEINNDTSKTKFSLALKQLLIENADIIYNDEKGNSYFETKNLTYNLNGDLNNDFTKIVNSLFIEQTTAKVGGVKYLNNAKIDFKIDLEADLKNNKYTLNKNSFKINALELNLNGWIHMQKNSSIDMDLNFNMPQISFKNILSLIPAVYSSNFKDINANGKVKFDGWVKGKKDSLHLPKFVFNLLVDNADFKYPSLPKTVKNIYVKLQAKNNYGLLDSTIIDLNKFHVEMENNKIDANILITNPIKDPSINAKIDVNIILKTLKDFVPLPENNKLEGNFLADIKLIGSKSMIDKKQYDKFKAEGILSLKDVEYKTPLIKEILKIKEISFGFTPKKINLNNFNATIGNSDLNANGSIGNFLEYLFKKDSSLIGAFNFSSNYLNTSNILVTDSTKTVSKKETKNEPMSIIEVPKNIEFTLNTKIKKLIHTNLNIDNINGSIKIKNQELLMNGLSLDMLDGNIKINGFYSTKNIKKPNVELDLSITKIDIQNAGITFNTISTITPYIKECYGKISCKIFLKSLLTDTMSPILSSLYSTGKINTYKLILKGENTNKLSELLKNNNLKEISINDIEIKYLMKDGKLIIDTTNFSTNGIKGSFAATYSLDKNLDAIINNNMPFDLVKNQVITPDVENILLQAKNNDINIKLPEYVGINITIRGIAPNYKYDVKFDKSFVNSIKENIKNEIDNKINKEKEKLINEGKKKLEKEKDKLINEGKKQLQNILPKW